MLFVQAPIPNNSFKSDSSIRYQLHALILQIFAKTEMLRGPARFVGQSLIMLSLACRLIVAFIHKHLELSSSVIQIL